MQCHAGAEALCQQKEEHAHQMAEHAEALVQSKLEAAEVQQQQRSAADLSLQRRLADAEDALNAARNDLGRERELRKKAAAAHDSSMARLAQNHADEMRGKDADHSDALVKRDRKIEQAARERDAIEQERLEAEAKWRSDLSELDKRKSALEKKLYQACRLATAGAEGDLALLDLQRSHSELTQALAGHEQAIAARDASLGALRQEARQEREQEELRRAELQQDWGCQAAGLREELSALRGELLEARATASDARGEAQAEGERRLAELRQERARDLALAEAGHAEALGRLEAEAAGLRAELPGRAEAAEAAEEELGAARELHEAGMARVQEEARQEREDAERRRIDSDREWRQRCARWESEADAAREELRQERKVAEDAQAAGAQALTQLRQCFARDLGQEASECAEALREHDEDLRRARQEADGRVGGVELREAEAGEAWQRRLEAAEQELRQERKVAEDAQAASAQALTQLHQCFARDLGQEASERAEALREHDEDLRRAQQEADRRVGGVELQEAEAGEAWQRRLEAAEQELREAKLLAASERELALRQLWRAEDEQMSAYVARSVEALAQRDADLKQAQGERDEARRCQLLTEEAWARKEARLEAAAGAAGWQHAELGRRCERAEEAHAGELRRLEQQGEERAAAHGQLEQQVAEAEAAWKRSLSRSSAELGAAREELMVEREAALSAEAGVRREVELELEACEERFAEAEAALREELADASAVAAAQRRARRKPSAERRKAHADELSQMMEAHAKSLDEQEMQVHLAQRRAEEAEGKQVEIEEQWRRKIALVEDDLRTAREELKCERDLVVRAQADGERAVLRTIEGFWRTQRDKEGPQPSPCA